MINSKTVLLPVIAMAVICVGATFDEGRTEKGPDVSGLLSADIRDRRAVVGEVLANRKAIAERVLRVAEKTVENEPEKAKTAVILLGKLRYSKAVPFLVKHLQMLSPPAVMKGTEPFLKIQRDYPCVRALIEIGTPSLDPLLKKLSQSNDDRTLNLTAAVYKELLGEKVALAYIRSQTPSEEGSVATKSISKLVDRIKKSSTHFRAR
jgi:hypothetical protein